MSASHFEIDVLAVSAAWDDALIANDAEAFGTFVSDDWVYVGPTGVTPKAAIIGWISTGRLAHYSMRTIEPPRVAIHGDTAIVTAHKASTGAWEGTAYAADEWISEVYVRRDGRWLCVLSQKSPVEPRVEALARISRRRRPRVAGFGDRQVSEARRPTQDRPRAPWVPARTCMGTSRRAARRASL